MFTCAIESACKILESMLIWLYAERQWEELIRDIHNGVYAGTIVLVGQDMNYTLCARKLERVLKHANHSRFDVIGVAGKANQGISKQALSAYITASTIIPYTRSMHTDV